MNIAFLRDTTRAKIFQFFSQLELKKLVEFEFIYTND